MKWNADQEGTGASYKYSAFKVYKANGLRDLSSYINEKGISKLDIINILQDNHTDEFILFYFM